MDRELRCYNTSDSEGWMITIMNCHGGRTNCGMRGLKILSSAGGLKFRFLAKRGVPALVMYIALLTFATSAAQAANRQWANAGAGGDWNTASNWTENDVPDTSAES